MSAEDAKLLMAVKRHESGDHATVLDIVKRILVDARLMRQQPDNYQIEAWTKAEGWCAIGHGTRDYCIGWATASEECLPEVDVYRVTCGSSIVWPEKWYLAEAGSAREPVE